MAYVVCEPCNDCKYTDCVVVCPCDCFYQDETQLYIDPEECIDCDCCVPECPVEAIFHESNVPSQWTHFIRLNAERVAALKETGGGITERQEPKEGPACRARRGSDTNPKR
jgi:ferredoxin